MKKNPISLALYVAFAVLITFSTCKKTNDTEEQTEAEVMTQSQDQSQFSSEMDAVANDADLAIESNSSISGRVTQIAVCDATVALDSTATSKTLTITYNGTTCAAGRARSGAVVLSIAKEAKWRTAGTAITVTVKDFKVTHDGKSITINGSKIMTNVSGGKLIELAQLGTIIHTITSDGLTITFSDGTKRIWHIAKKRVYSYQNGIKITMTGTHEEAGRTGIAEWGVDRLGNEFSTQIAEPLVLRQDCDFRLGSGKVVYKNQKAELSITFGLDASGVATSCPGTGKYYYKAEWVNARNIAQSFMSQY